ncbi:unnamed protein product, partial [Toxocara canis]|uniref:Uncharacterized protein n=1 Tax=Toxocara canis TaxID=6265 RepID=A0A183VFX9_TOXCA
MLSASGVLVLQYCGENSGERREGNRSERPKRVIGCTAASRCSISVDENKGIIAYPAGLGRSAILANHRNNTFVDVCCAPNNKTFSITETKTLVESNDEKLVNTYDLNGETPYSMVLGIGELFIGFNNGTIRCFDVQSVTHKRTYCKTHYLLCDVAMGRYVDALLSTSHPANG